ncbi:MAG: DNA replication and repair protein RecF, partial [Bacteroidota bacterium]
LSEFIGQFPVVILSPENNKITFGSPADRRRFLDLVISQSSRSYLQDLLEYRRALRQRNKILLDAKLAQRDPGEQIDPWTENLVAHGVRVIQKRGEFLKNFRPHLVEAYREIAGGKEEPGLRYRTITGRHNTEETNSLTERFRSAVTRIAAEERRMGSTLVGPHRDELEMTINGLELRKFASQGQHRTFLIALKLAEFHYLYGRCKETPMLILDDVFSELDREREQRMFGLAQSLGQTFITATDRSSLRGVRHPERVRWFTVEQGTLTNGETQSGND